MGVQFDLQAFSVNWNTTKPPATDGSSSLTVALKGASPDDRVVVIFGGPGETVDASSVPPKVLLPMEKYAAFRAALADAQALPGAVKVDVSDGPPAQFKLTNA